MRLLRRSRAAPLGMLVLQQQPLQQQEQELILLVLLSLKSC
jgi:hypothetical protein